MGRHGAGAVKEGGGSSTLGLVTDFDHLFFIIILRVPKIQESRSGFILLLDPELTNLCGRIRSLEFALFALLCRIRILSNFGS